MLAEWNRSSVDSGSRNGIVKLSCTGFPIVCSKVVAIELFRLFVESTRWQLRLCRVRVTVGRWCGRSVEGGDRWLSLFVEGSRRSEGRCARTCVETVSVILDHLEVFEGKLLTCLWKWKCNSTYKIEGRRPLRNSLRSARVTELREMWSSSSHSFTLPQQTSCQYKH